MTRSCVVKIIVRLKRNALFKRHQFYQTETVTGVLSATQALDEGQICRRLNKFDFPVNPA